MSSGIPWRCNACGAKGSIEIVQTDDPAALRYRIAEAHAIANVECHIEKCDSSIGYSRGAHDPAPRKSKQVDPRTGILPISEWGSACARGPMKN